MILTQIKRRRKNHFLCIWYLQGCNSNLWGKKGKRCASSNASSNACKVWKTSGMLAKPFLPKPQSFCRKHPSTISSLWVVLWKTVSFCGKHVGTKSSHFCQSWDSLLTFCTGSQSKLANLVHISDLQLPNEWQDVVEIACKHFAPGANQANLVHISCGHKLIARKNPIKVLVNSYFSHIALSKT